MLGPFRDRSGRLRLWPVALLLWTALVVGMVWNAAPDVPPAVASPERELLGELPPGYRYELQPDTDPATDDWHTATLLVLRGCMRAATVTVIGRDGGAHVSFTRGQIEHDSGARLSSTDLVRGDAFAGWLSDREWVLVAQRGEVVVSIHMPPYSEGRRLSRAILN
ncbi:MAG TPA: hypothetical protein VHF88_01875 [Thermoleophilaceae bacterium]|nr:hypothetical protein [Thermoleophilaceae bacterium]